MLSSSLRQHMLRDNCLHVSLTYLSSASSHPPPLVSPATRLGWGPETDNTNYHQNQLQLISLNYKQINQNRQMIIYIQKNYSNITNYNHTGNWLLLIINNTNNVIQVLICNINIWINNTLHKILQYRKKYDGLIY